MSVRARATPNQIVDFGEFVVWRANGDSYSFDVFICSHGGYDQDKGHFNLPDYGSGKPNFYFYGPHGKSITEAKANMVIASDNPTKYASSIVAPGSGCWNYILAEYPNDWFKAATKSAKEAADKYGELHDCLLIKGSSGTVTLKSVVDTLMAKKVKYLNYHYLACRSTVGLERRPTG